MPLRRGRSRFGMGIRRRCTCTARGPADRGRAGDGREAGRIAEEVIPHLSGLVGAGVRVTLGIEAELSDGAPGRVVRTVTENSRKLRFTQQGFEKE